MQRRVDKLKGEVTQEEKQKLEKEIGELNNQLEKNKKELGQLTNSNK